MSYPGYCHKNVVKFGTHLHEKYDIKRETGFPEYRITRMRMSQHTHAREV